MVRDKIGSFMTRRTCEQLLNNWIIDYVLAQRTTPASDVKAQVSAARGAVDVRDVTGKPGCYEAVAFLRPHFQLEG